MKKFFLLFYLYIFPTINTLINAQVPTIISVIPTSGPIGTVVTITGTNFNTTSSNNIVWFGATRATITNATLSQLTVIVPEGATLKPITITVSGLTGYSKDPFIVTFPGFQPIDANSFAGKVDFPTGMSPYMVEIVDIDGDGKPDIVATSGNHSYILPIFRNISTPGSINAGSLASKIDLTTPGPYAIEVTHADIDGDGKQDLLLANHSTNLLSIYRNISSAGSISAGSFAARVDFTTGSNPFGVVVRDFDDDGKSDIAVSNNGSNTISVFRNTSVPGSISAGSLASKVDFPTGDTPQGIVATDVDGDGKTDIIVNNASGNSVSVFRNTCSQGSITPSSFAAKVDFATGTYPYFLVSGDLDGDNKPDIAVNNVSDHTISVLRNTSTTGSITSTSFALKVDFPTTYQPESIGIGDLNGDGKPELVATNGGVSVYMNTSIPGSITSSSFAPRVDYSTDSGPKGVKIGDIDGDGKADILTAGGSISILKNTISTLPEPPSAPSALAATSILQNGFYANWSSSGTATGYYLDVSANNTFTSFVTGYNNRDAGNITSLIVTGLSAGTIYYYRVRAYNTGGTSTSSNTVPVTTLPNTPSAPTAYASGSTTESAFTASWSSSATATGYRLDVSTNTEFTAFLPGYTDLQVTGTSYSVTGLNESTTYYYRVRAFNSAGTSPNSNIITAVTSAKSPTAPLATAATSLLKNGFTANWNSSPKATGYWLDVATDNSFTSFVNGYNNLYVGNTTSQIVASLSAYSNYYYRIRASNSGGNSTNSNTITLTTLPNPPVAPSGLSATSCNNIVKLTWNANSEPNFLRYVIYGGTSPNPTTRVDSTSNVITETTKTIAGLKHGQKYYFRVTAVLSPRVEGPYSNESNVSVTSGFIPKIKLKWNDVLVCYNLSDSISSYQWVKNNSVISDAKSQYYISGKQSGAYKVETIDKNGCKNSSNEIILSGTKSIAVYPNPASMSFTISFNDDPVGKTIISIFNKAGVKVKEYQTEKIDSDFFEEVPIFDLDDGAYLILVTVNKINFYYSKILVIK